MIKEYEKEPSTKKKVLESLQKQDTDSHIQRQTVSQYTALGAQVGDYSILVETPRVYF